MLENWSNRNIDHITTTKPTTIFSASTKLRPARGEAVYSGSGTCTRIRNHLQDRPGAVRVVRQLPCGCANKARQRLRPSARIPAGSVDESKAWHEPVECEKIPASAILASRSRSSATPGGCGRRPPGTRPCEI